MREVATSVAVRCLLVWFVLAAMRTTQQPGGVGLSNECACGGDAGAERAPSLLYAGIGFTASVVAVVLTILLIGAVSAPPAAITVALRGSI
jgi:hypothetical protein